MGKGSAKGKCAACYRKAYKATYYIDPVNRENRRTKSAAYHQANKMRVNAQITQRRRELRERVMATLGGKCRCCGETTPVFLTLDHINGDGALVRKVARHLIFKQVEDEGCPPDRYQVLCWNCNSAKHILGRCPHS